MPCLFTFLSNTLYQDDNNPVFTSKYGASFAAKSLMWSLSSKMIHLTPLRDQVELSISHGEAGNSQVIQISSLRSFLVTPRFVAVISY